MRPTWEPVLPLAGVNAECSAGVRSEIVANSTDERFDLAALPQINHSA
jgi:hypothetical protein